MSVGSPAITITDGEIRIGENERGVMITNCSFAFNHNELLDRMEERMARIEDKLQSIEIALMKVYYP